MLCYVMLYYVMLCYVMLCYVMLCYVMLCYAMLCYVMLCYVSYRSLHYLRTGEELALLLKMQFEAPEMFYRCATKMLKIKEFSSLARLVWSLADIV